MEKSNITIIGAGAVGLAIAAGLSEKYNNIIILEKNQSFGQETSSRNSEVIHSGIYYPPGTLKARLCVKGNALLYEYCLKNGINHQKTGKVIVAVKNSEVSELEALRINGMNNGVLDLKIIDKASVNRMEPGIKAVAGLFAPNTGIFDTHCFMQTCLNNARAKGAIISYNSEVTAVDPCAEGYRITVNNGNFQFISKILINCAGLNSGNIAEITGIDIDAAGYRIHYCKGNYFRPKKQISASRLIYPVPSLHGLGIHLTKDLGGGVRFGPDTEYVKDLDYSVNPGLADKFAEAISSYIPSIKPEDLYPDMCGIRPKIQGPDDSFRDFVIRNESDKGLNGLINLIGIESPGLTSSLAIAEYAGRIVEETI